MYGYFSQTRQIGTGKRGRKMGRVETRQAHIMRRAAEMREIEAGRKPIRMKKLRKHNAHGRNWW